MKRIVKPGDKIQDAVTASWFNEQNKKQTTKPSPFPTNLPENSVKIECHADTSMDFARFEAANIVGPAIPYEDFDGDAVQYSTAAVKVNDTLVADRWGIVQSPCIPDNPSQLVVLGVTWALFDYTEDDTHVDIVGGALVSGTSGKAIILSPPESAGKPGLIFIAAAAATAESRLFRFTLNEDFTTGTADADIIEMDGTDTTIDDYVLDPLGIFAELVNGNVGLCIRQDGNYYAIQAPCPDDQPVDDNNLVGTAVVGTAIVG